MKTKQPDIQKNIHFQHSGIEAQNPLKPSSTTHKWAFFWNLKGKITKKEKEIYIHCQHYGLNHKNPPKLSPKTGK